MNPELQPETKRLLEQGNDLMKRFNEQNPTIISASNLNKNTQPYSLPTAPTQPTTGNLAQATNSSIANAVTTATLDRPTNPAKEQASSLLSKLISNQQNQASEVNKINQDEQVFQKKQAATTLKNDLDQFDKQYRDEVEAIKKNSQGKFGGAVEQDLRKAEERYQNVRANKVLSYNSAIGDYQGASEIAQSKIAALKEQNAQELNLYKLAVDAVNNDLTESEKLVAQANIQEKQQKAKTLEDAYASAVQVGLDNGANQNYFNALDTAKESGNVSAIASTISSYGYKSLDQQLQQAQLQKISKEIDDTGSANVSSIMNDPSLTGSTKNGAVITALLGGSKVGQGTRTQLANVLGVINAAEDLANQRLAGKFKGISPLNTLLDLKVPFTDIGIPFRSALTQKEGTENRQYLEAINLRTQIWASGASLTSQQIEQVNKFTPRPNDTDEKVREKTNGLVNFMLNQTKSQLQSEGIDFTPERVNLFETMDMIDNLSPQQKKELQDQGLI